MQSAFRLIIIMLSVTIMLCVVILNIGVLRVVTINVIFLVVIRLNVVAPFSAINALLERVPWILEILG